MVIFVFNGCYVFEGAFGLVFLVWKLLPLKLKNALMVKMVESLAHTHYNLSSRLKSCVDKLYVYFIVNSQRR